MPKRSDVVAEQLDELRQNLEELWAALVKDPKAQARKERAWSMLAGLLGVAATMAARRALTKLWPILTGEPPPPAQQAQREAQQRSSGQREAAEPRESTGVR